MNQYRMCWIVALVGLMGIGIVATPAAARTNRGRSKPAPPKELTEFVGIIKTIDLKTQEMTVAGSNKMTNKTLSKPTTRTFKVSPFCRVKADKKPMLSTKQLAVNMEVEVSYDDDAKQGLIARNIFVNSEVPNLPPPAPAGIPQKK